MRQVWVLGNGRSLLTKPWPESAVLIGCNYVHLAEIFPHYYICIDQDMIVYDTEQVLIPARRAAMAYISNLFVEEWRCRSLYRLPNVMLAQERIQTLPGELAFSGCTAVYVGIKLAMQRGYDKIHLVGIDQDKGFEHFSPEYPKAKRPKQNLMQFHFRLAAAECSRRGIVLVNHSLPSPLDEFIQREPC